MTQEGLAEAAGLERAYLSALERGKRNPTLLTMHKVARALGVSLDDLLSDAEEID